MFGCDWKRREKVNRRRMGRSRNIWRGDGGLEETLDTLHKQKRKGGGKMEQIRRWFLWGL